jgi:hypothetical protein
VKREMEMKIFSVESLFRFPSFLLDTSYFFLSWIDIFLSLDPWDVLKLSLMIMSHFGFSF